MTQGTETSTPYVPLYIDPLLLLADDFIALKALLVLLKCADAWGWCFPGDEYIGGLVHCRRDSAGDALERLQLKGLIQIVYTPRPHRKKDDRDIQISPEVIALKPECREKALEDWKTHSADRTTYLAPSVDRHAVKDTEVDRDGVQVSLKRSTTNRTNNRSNSITNSSDPTSEPTTTTNSGVENAGLPARGLKTANEKGEGQGQEQGHGASADPTNAVGTAAAPQHQRRMARDTPTPLSPPPLVKPVKSALSDEHGERVAGQMKQSTGGSMSIAVARGLVVAYGADLCQTAAINLSKKRRVQNPGGMLKWMIEHGQVDPDKDGKSLDETQEREADGKKYISGKYADAINH